MFCSSSSFLNLGLKKKKEEKTKTGRPQNGTEIKLSLKVQYNCGARVPHTVAQPSLCVLLTPQLQSPLGELGLCAFVIPTVLSH